MCRPSLVAVAARERRLELPPHVRVTDDLAEVAGADDVDVVVELMGGTDTAGTVIRQALAAGKSVVSANKELLAKQGRELEAAARAAGAGLRFEAAVAAGVPVLGPLVWDLGANRMTALRGIVNGTTNHILSTMASDGREYADVLREAQARGYAEADPSSDVEGLDAAYKLTLLARLAFDGWLDVASLRRSIPVFGAEPSPGITGVVRSHLGAAARLGLTIKLVARAERPVGGGVRAGVTPMAVTAASPLGATRGVTNLIDIDAEPVGRVSMAGPGAGGPATASAVLADLLVFAKSHASTWEQLPAAPGRSSPTTTCSASGPGSSSFPTSASWASRSRSGPWRWRRRTRASSRDHRAWPRWRAGCCSSMGSCTPTPSSRTPESPCA